MRPAAARSLIGSLQVGGIGDLFVAIGSQRHDVGRDDVGMTDLRIRPTTEIRSVILGSMDRMFEQLMERLDGLTDAEYLWNPVSGAWSVRAAPDGRAVVDGAGDRETDPARVTTIAWRLWHVAMDCLDDYTRRFGGDESDAPATWTLDATRAIDLTRLRWQEYRSLVAGLDWWSELGDTWGHWSRHSVADMAMHASNELVHHGAEIALLRDLYRSSGPDGTA